MFPMASLILQALCLLYSSKNTRLEVSLKLASVLQPRTSTPSIPPASLTQCRASTDAPLFNHSTKSSNQTLPLVSLKQTSMCPMGSLTVLRTPGRASTDTFLDQTATVEEGLMRQGTSEFDPERHLAFKEPSSILMMKDIGYENVGVSPVAVTQAFQLFSPEAIKIMRSEVVKQEVMSDHYFASNIASAQLRGYARKHAPFTFAAWNHPATLAIISKLARIDLIPWSDYEIAHINLSVTKEDQVKSELAVPAHSRQTPLPSDEGIDFRPQENNKPIVGWHTDSYPFVCVLMLSDCTDMVGGETELLKPDGSVIRVRGPTAGCAVILQGRYITHQALRAVGAKERITAVTSFRPRSPFVEDDSVLRTVRPVSNLKELYPDFAEYRLEILKERIQRELDELRASRAAGKPFKTRDHKGFLKYSVDFMQHTNDELVAEDQVQSGVVEPIHVQSVGSAAPVKPVAKL